MFYWDSRFAPKDFKKILEVFLQIFIPFKTYIFLLVRKDMLLVRAYEIICALSELRICDERLKKILEVFLQIFIPFKTHILFHIV